MQRTALTVPSCCASVSFSWNAHRTQDRRRISVCVDVGASEIEGWVVKKLKALKASSLSRCRWWCGCGSLVGRLPTSDPQVKAIWEPAEHRRWGTLPLPLPLAIPFFALAPLGYSSVLPRSSCPHLAGSWDPPTANCCGPSALCW